jgi:cyclophilin family peptidyl-prolyl cis-trans isomerase
LLFYILIV